VESLEAAPMSQQPIPYVDPATVTDPRMRQEIDRSYREATPRPESHLIRAHVPAVFWSFADTWETVFRNGVVDHSVKELCRVYVSKLVNCAYCGNQRSVRAASAGVIEEDYRQLMNYERSDRYDERQKAALSLAEAIAGDREADSDVWDRLHRHFSDAELVELGYFIGMTTGQQRFNRILQLEEHPAPRPASLV
jgi:alkylhydroperoxidase family enzyme